MPAVSAEPIRHSGLIAPRVRVLFTFDPATRRIATEIEGEWPRRHGYAKALARYRTLRHEFLERVAAITGEAVNFVEWDEDGQPDALHVVDPPVGGRA